MVGGSHSCCSVKQIRILTPRTARTVKFIMDYYPTMIIHHVFTWSQQNIITITAVISIRDRSVTKKRIVAYAALSPMIVIAHFSPLPHNMVSLILNYYRLLTGLLIYLRTIRSVSLCSD